MPDTSIYIHTSLEYGLSPPKRIKSRRNREMVKKRVHTMAGCLGQKEEVTDVHNVCIRELLQEVNVHGKADRHMRLLTIETESRLGTLWDQEECNQFCSKQELWEAS